MLKTISAALLAVSVIAAPALAETSGKTTQAPVSKTVQAPVNKTAQAPVIKADQAKSKLMNANANMGTTSTIAIIATTSTWVRSRRMPRRRSPGITQLRPPSAADTDPLGVVRSTLPRRASGYPARPMRHCFPNGRGLVPSPFFARRLRRFAHRKRARTPEDR